MPEIVESRPERTRSSFTSVRLRDRAGDRPPRPAAPSYPAGVLNEELSRRLEEAGVTASEDQLEELATAYPALREWIAVAERLGGGAPEIPELS